MVIWQIRHFIKKKLAIIIISTNFIIWTLLFFNLSPSFPFCANGPYIKDHVTFDSVQVQVLRPRQRPRLKFPTLYDSRSKHFLPFLGKGIGHI